MVKCGRVGCPKDAIHHEKVPIDGGLVADTHFCDDHYKEGIASIKGEKAMNENKFETDNPTCETLVKG